MTKRQTQGVTIVGGRPPQKMVDVADLPVGIEQVLTIAALNPSFKAELVQDPVSAAQRRGIQLDEAELLLVQTADRNQLEAMVSRMVVPPEMSRRSFNKAVAASVVAMVSGGTAQMACVSGASKGISPDHPYDCVPGGSAIQDWVQLAGYTCYRYTPGTIRCEPDIENAPILCALHGAAEDCLANISRWNTAADAKGFHILSNYWATR